ncbi:hypothetical protein KP79_PYT04415 [Mizuhopecten yessoensis]|uniref:Uncharacterized protein n=1 Tax=Mizuhopecten yessoensis TaxID=6573 RepID=A0A210R0Y0_MIZYE|nr:hypothetical protein KP79_PYT04415 [Mizuhopecten yessoensis]
MDKKPEISKEAADAFIACGKTGNINTMVLFAATFGVAYLAQGAYMYKTKKFLKSKNRALLPLGAAFLPSYFYYWSVLYNCRKEMGKNYPQCFETKGPR